MTEELNTHYLFPGNIFAHSEPHVVTTVLGSCVSVCLFDPIKKIGGINHFMLPLWNGEGLASPKYGNIAIPKLIDKMLSLGCIKKRLVAKVFGGGEVLTLTHGVLNVGERNIIMANNLLAELNIKVISKDVAGTQGRKLIYYTDSNKILMKRLRKQVNDIKS
jgi:chemotaxis protein CheD